MSSLRERLGLPSPGVSVSPAEALDEMDKIFEDAFKQVSKASVVGSVVVKGGGGAGGAGRNVIFNPGPTEAHAELAEKILLKLIEQADSIICDPDDLSKRAWAMADAMMKQYEERLK